MNGDDLEQWANWLNDNDREWWPFLFMRPEPHERITSLRAAALAALYGVLAGLFMNAVIALSGFHAARFSPLLFPVGATLGFFLVYRSTFAYFWNRRAERLATSLRRRSGGVFGDRPSEE